MRGFMKSYHLVIFPLVFFTGLSVDGPDFYFFLGNTTYPISGSVVLVSDIGPHSANLSDPGSTLVCVSPYFQNDCCRLTGTSDGSCGWYYPNGNAVLRDDGPVTCMLHGDQLRLGIRNPVGLNGKFLCRVPSDENGTSTITATIYLDSDILNVGYIGGIAYPNNSIISFNAINMEDRVLICYTNLSQCCRNGDHPEGIALGQWKFPNGELVQSQADTNIDFFSRTRRKSGVVLHRGMFGNEPSGIFTCEVPDSTNVLQQRFFGLYAANEGFARVLSVMYHVDSGWIECLSEGGPATNVVWNRNGPSYKQTKRVLNLVTASYISTLSISSTRLSDYVGSFKCEVSNERGASSKNTGYHHAIEISQLENNSFAIGSKATLVCFSNFTVTDIDWTGTGGSSRLDKQRTRQHESVLVIKNLVEGDNNRIFTCLVSISLPNGKVVALNKSFTVYINKSNHEFGRFTTQSPVVNVISGTIIYVIVIGVAAAIVFLLILIILVLCIRLQRRKRSYLSNSHMSDFKLESEDHMYAQVKGGNVQDGAVEPLSKKESKYLQAEDLESSYESMNMITSKEDYSKQEPSGEYLNLNSLKESEFKVCNQEDSSSVIYETVS